MEIKEKLIEIVGKDYFLDDPQMLRLYSKDYSLTSPGMANYIVKPGGVEEIQRIIKLANEYRIPVIPCSSQVHFTGATIPKQGGIIMDLKRMNRILKIDERNRYCRIEPGVTWGQLQKELKNKDLMALTPLLPHSFKSVLTSHLEREPMLISSKYEFADPLLTMEVVFPNGELFRTGSASVPGVEDFSALASGVCPYGPGIDWYMFFMGAQGTMGVVTWANIKIEYLPKINKIFFLPFKRIEDVIDPLYRVQKRIIGHECLILNNINLATILAEEWPYDFERLQDVLPPWTLILVLAGGYRRPEEKIAYEEESLQELRHELPSISLMTNLPGAVIGNKKLINMLRNPWPEEITYWKLRYKGSCQDLFFITTLDKVSNFLKIVDEFSIRYKYPIGDFGCYIQPLELGRACHCEFNFYYNPDDTKNIETTRRLYTEVSENLLNAGVLFTRPYGILADLVYSKATGYTATLNKIKNYFDPNNIMNPGNLCF